MDLKEIASIEGFDEDTALELQTRARDHLAKIEAELDEKRKELGVEDALKEVPGVTTAMLVQASARTASRPSRTLRAAPPTILPGWTERKDGEAVRQAGILDGFDHLARGGRGDDHAGAPEGRLDHRGRSRAAARRGGSGRRGAGLKEQYGTHDRRNPSYATIPANSIAGRTRANANACASLRATVRPVSDLIRFVVGPDGEAVPDIKCKLPGRGVWVTATQEALEDAIKRKAFARGFKRDVRLPPDLAARTERLLAQAVLDALGDGRTRPGLVAAGFAKDRPRWSARTWSPYCMRPRASPDGVRKLGCLSPPPGAEPCRSL